MALTPDKDLISCHALNTGNGPTWLLVDGVRRCSHCASIHPDAFVAAIKNEKFISGWHRSPKKNLPIYCETQMGRFYMAHLKDMRLAWLMKHTLLIFEQTMVLFYWQKDRLRHTSFGVSCPLLDGQRANKVQLDRAERFLTRKN